MVESIKILPPEFQGRSFRDDESLGQRKVKQILRRPAQRALGSRTVAEGLLWGSVSGRIKPQVAVGMGDMGSANDIRANMVENCAKQRRDGDEVDEGSTGKNRSDPAETPAADNRVRYLARLSSLTSP